MDSAHEPNYKPSPEISPRIQSEGFLLIIPEDQLICKELIGKGTFSNVYIGKFKNAFWNTDVALKYNKIVGRIVNDLNTEILDQLKSILKLNHVNVITYIGICLREDQSTILIMEYAKGGTLSNYLESDTKITLKIKVLYALQICRGMNYLHGNKILHRDLKAKNVVMTMFPSSIENMSFNIMKLINYNCCWSTGTISHMAPEAMNHKASMESDVWSFGVTMWELVYQDRPYRGYETLQVIYRVGILKKTLDLPENLSPILKDIIINCWKYEISERFTFDKLIEGLELFLTYI